MREPLKLLHFVSVVCLSSITAHQFFDCTAVSSGGLNRKLREVKQKITFPGETTLVTVCKIIIIFSLIQKN